MKLNSGQRSYYLHEENWAICMLVIRCVYLSAVMSAARRFSDPLKVDSPVQMLENVSIQTLFAHRIGVPRNLVE